ncbi:MAG: hypothetical protein V4613_05485 [Bacteroidota bacterium]
MKPITAIITILLLTSCGHRYDITVEQQKLFNQRQAQQLDTLIGYYTSSTGSLDLFILEGKLTFPEDIKKQLYDSLTSDIKVCGNFPKDLIDINTWNYDTDIAFKIVGKTIKADSINAIGKVPLFFVTEWTKFDYPH